MNLKKWYQQSNNPLKYFKAELAQEKKKWGHIRKVSLNIDKTNNVKVRFQVNRQKIVLVINDASMTGCHMEEIDPYPASDLINKGGSNIWGRGKGRERKGGREEEK